jgi:hypothetical protein
MFQIRIKFLTEFFLTGLNYIKQVKLAKKQKWQPQDLKINQTKVSDARMEQLLAEVGEILYKRICQQVSALKNTDLYSSTEPSLTGTDKVYDFTQNQIVLKKGS